MDNDPPLRGRHRDRNGEISKKHGNTLIRTLRRVYGPGFAPGFKDTDALSYALETLDERSLSQIVHDHEKGQLHAKLREHGSPTDAPTI